MGRARPGLNLGGPKTGRAVREKHERTDRAEPTHQRAVKARPVQSSIEHNLMKHI